MKTAEVIMSALATWKLKGIECVCHAEASPQQLNNYKFQEIFINQPLIYNRMVTRIGTKQRKTRHKLTLHYRQRGKLPLSQYFQEFKEGDRVNLKINSSVQTGQFYPRFHGFDRSSNW